MSLFDKASLLSGKNYWESRDMPDYGITSLFFSDGPSGLRKQIKDPNSPGLNPSFPATCFPSMSTNASTWDPALLESIGKAIGEEAVNEGVNVLLAPGVNIKRNPLCGRNFEYFSEDPYLTGFLASSFIRGVQSNGIAACVKHFACNNQETRRLSIDTILDERTLREIYLEPFEMAVKDGGVKCVMSAYNRVGGYYCNENMHLQQGILRGDWGFDGVVITDWGADNDRVKGLLAGNSLEMPSTGGETNRDVSAAVRLGFIKKDELDKSVDRLLTLVDETKAPFRKKSKKHVDFEAHHKLAEKAAEEGIVLLKNDKNILPLNDKESIAIIGDFAKEPRYQGAGSAIVNPTKLDKFLDLAKKSNLNIRGYEKGYMRFGQTNHALISKAVSLAKKSDISLIFLGLDEVTEGEGFDRKSLSLPQNQLKLLNAVLPICGRSIIVISGGSVVDLPFVDKTDAILFCSLFGQAGASALLNILTGKTNPSGKLTETFPISYSDVPSSHHFANNEKTVEYREALYVGYRYYETAGVRVRFPFGYGLSYSKFEYSDLSIDNLGAYFTLKNISNRAGDEICELYVSMPNSKIFRPALELKGFKRVHLEAGEKKRINIFFDDKTFRYFNVLTNCFEIEEGEYSIKIGTSSEDIRLEKIYKVKGTLDSSPYDSTVLPSYFSGKILNVSEQEFSNLLGHTVPSANQELSLKGKHMVVDSTTIIADLRYSKGLISRTFAFDLRFIMSFLRHFGERQKANTIQFGIYYQPMRSLARMTLGKISWKQMQAVIEMANGHFLRGLFHFLREGHYRRVIAKAERIASTSDKAKMREIASKDQQYKDILAMERQAHSKIGSHNIS